MDFFEEVDTIGIVENHVQRVLKLEESKAKALLRRYKEVRQELRDRLDRFPEGTFTNQQLRGVLVQVDAAIIAMNQSLKEGMGEVSPEVALLGVEDQLDEIQKFEKYFTGAVVPININAQLIAEDTNNFLINKYEASISAYSESVRSMLTTNLTNEMLMESSLSKVVRQLGTFFQGEEWKLLRIARTELHNSYNLGKMNGMLETRDQVLPDLMKTLYIPMDARTGSDSKALSRQSPIVPIDEPFVQVWKGQKRVYMAPPDRPNDRSILIPYRKDWENTP